MNVDIFVDLDRHFKKTNSGNIKKTNTIETIDQSIKTILSTVPGERVMLPTFGSKLKYLLFEPMNPDTALLIASEIRERISIWEDRVFVQDVYIQPDYDRNVYKTYITYVYIITNVKYTLETNIRNLA